MANLRATPIDGVLVAASLVVMGLLGSGCAAGSRQPASKAPAFREIQRHEAGLQQAWAEADQPGVSCARRCVLAQRASTRAASLCNVADEVDDRDATVRCERGRRTAEALKGRVRAECECDAGTEAKQPR